MYKYNIKKRRLDLGLTLEEVGKMVGGGFKGQYCKTQILAVTIAVNKGFCRI